MAMTLPMFLFLLAMGLGAVTVTAQMRLPGWICNLSGILTVSIFMVLLS